MPASLRGKLHGRSVQRLSEASDATPMRTSSPQDTPPAVDGWSCEQLFTYSDQTGYLDVQASFVLKMEVLEQDVLRYMFLV